jgi:hypothetical protein
MANQTLLRHLLNFLLSRAWLVVAGIVIGLVLRFAYPVERWQKIPQGISPREMHSGYLPE